MNYTHLFPDKEIDFDYYLRAIELAIFARPVVSCKTNMEIGVDALSRIDSDEKIRKLIDTSVLVDKRLTEPYAKRNDLFHKLPVLMTVANLVGNHYDQIKDLSIEQLALLSEFSYVVREDHMATHLKFFSNGELLQSVLDKSPEEREQMEILSVIEDKYFEFGIDKKDDLALNNFRNEMMSFVKESPKEDILSMKKPIEVLFAEAINKGLRI